MLAGLIAFGFAAEPTDADRRWPTYEEVERSAPSQSANWYLPSDAATSIASRQIEREQMLPGGVRLSFSTKVRNVGPGLCGRDQYEIYAIRAHDGTLRAGSATQATPRPQLKIASSCEGIDDGLFASVQPGSPPDEASDILAWLNQARVSAGRGGRLPISLSCKSEAKPDRCQLGTRAALAQLPLEKTFAIGRLREQSASWELYVTETRPGDAVWTVTVDRSAKKPTIDMRWHYPAPF